VPPRSDPELIRRCLLGEQKAWDRFVDRYARLVFSIPRRYGLTEEDAADVTQDVFLAAFRRLESLQDRTRASAWLLTIAVRESRRWVRKAAGTAVGDIVTADPAAEADDRLAEWERSDTVRRALEELGGPCRELLEALFMEMPGGDYRTVARRLGMKVPSIGPTRARCFRKLEAILVRDGCISEDPARLYSAEGDHPWPQHGSTTATSSPTPPET
jgi:RNA polymerase sigma factor (sigma-70 family)